jgi:hypothetical protein
MKNSLLAFYILFSSVLCAQEPTPIKVKRESKLVKMYFDNTEYKLIPIDRFGNPQDNAVKSYKFWIKGQDGFLPGYDNSLTPDMIKALKKVKKAAKIYFTEINVEDENGHLLKMPDVYEVWFPDCKNCGSRNK